MPRALGFLDVSGISLSDSSAGIWPSLPSFSELTSTAVPAAAPEDVCSSSGSHERAGEWLAPAEASGKAAPFRSGSEAGIWEESSHVQVFVLWLSPPPQCLGWDLEVSEVTAPSTLAPGSAGLLSPILCVSGEATWSGSEFEVSFPDSPGAQAQQDHLPQLTLPDSLTSAASPEDGLSAELLEAQAEEEPASTASPGLRAEAEAASQAQLATPE